MDNQNKEGLSFYDYFLPFTAKKAILFIIIIGILVYFNSLFNTFVWDDLLYIINNPQVHTIHILFGFRQNFFNRLGQYRPIPEIYFSILYALFNTNPFYYHIIQLLMHIGNTVLLFFLFQKFFDKKLSFFLSIIFLIHPLQVESVSFISSSDNTLFLLFGITALLLSFTKQISIKRQILIFLLLLLSLLTKETGVGFVCLVFLYTLLNQVKYVKSFLIGSILTICIYSLIRFGFGGITFDDSQSKWIIPMLDLSFTQRIINTPLIMLYYLQNFIFPLNIAIDQEWYITSINLMNFYIPLLIDLLIFACIISLGIYQYKSKKRIKSYLFFACWFIGGLSIYSQIAPLDSTVADRWFYFPIIGLLGLIGIVVTDLKFQNKRFFGVVAAAIILCLSIRTIVRNTDWVNNIVLYTHDSAISTNFDLENNLGIDLLAQGQCKLSLIHFSKTVQFIPTDFSYGNLGLANVCLKNYNQAEFDFTKAMHVKGYLVTSHIKHTLPLYINAINFFVFSNNPRLALPYINDGLRDYPHSSVLYQYLAADEYRIGNKNQASEDEKIAQALPKNLEYTNAYILVKNGSYEVYQIN